MTHWRLYLVVLFLSLPAVAHADVDLTGNWTMVISNITAAPWSVTCAGPIVQAGTALDVQCQAVGSGTIDPQTGAVTLSGMAILNFQGVATQNRIEAVSQPFPGGCFPPGCYLVGTRDGTMDADGDGVMDGVDNCPFLPNTQQENADGDSLGDACDTCPADPENDADHDLLCGDVDNCPLAPNADQADYDSDGSGNACDLDADGDGVSDATEPTWCLPSNLGEPVTAKGCSVSQVCPCGSPLGRAGWNKRSEYRRCVKEAATELATQGRITSDARRAILRSVRESLCGA